MNRSLALLVLIPLAAACSSGDDASTNDKGADTSVSATSVASEATADADVNIADFKFAAPDVHIKVGGSVTWTNSDDQAHTATSSGNFDAGAIDPAQSSTVVFPTAGTFTYVCSFHPFMTGTVVVD